MCSVVKSNVLGLLAPGLVVLVLSQEIFCCYNLRKSKYGSLKAGKTCGIVFLYSVFAQCMRGCVCFNAVGWVAGRASGL